MAEWHPGIDMSRVSVSISDRDNGSPKQGDMIARNPANHDDMWLVAAEYFQSNFESTKNPGICACCGINAWAMANAIEESQREAAQLRTALKGVLAEADRKTDAFDRAHTALGNTKDGNV